MKYFKNIVTLITLFAFAYMNPKNIGRAVPQPAPVSQAKPIPTRTVPSTQPIRKPAPMQPVKKESYKDLVDYVKNARNAWDAQKGMLNSSFVTIMVQKGQAANLESFQIEALLQTARDVHGIFSGNPQKDIAILQSVDKQINNAVLQ